MSHSYEYDSLDGRPVPPLVITSDHSLNGTHRGTVHVESGTLHLQGILQGTLDVQSGANAIITGDQRGTVAIASGATVTVLGAIHGTAHLEAGARLVIEDSGKLAGTLVNQGVVILRGVFGGERIGTGHLRIEGNGHIKEPVIRNGVQYYDL